MDLQFFKPQREYKSKIFIQNNHLWFSEKTAKRWNLELLKYFAIGYNKNKKKDNSIYLIITNSSNIYAFELESHGNYYKIYCPSLKDDYKLKENEKMYLSIDQANDTDNYKEKILKLTPI